MAGRFALGAMTDKIQQQSSTTRKCRRCREGKERERACGEGMGVRAPQRDKERRQVSESEETGNRKMVGEPVRFLGRPPVLVPAIRMGYSVHCRIAVPMVFYPTTRHGREKKGARRKGGTTRGDVSSSQCTSTGAPTRPHHSPASLANPASLPIRPTQSAMPPIPAKHLTVGHSPRCRYWTVPGSFSSYQHSPYRPGPSLNTVRKGPSISFHDQAGLRATAR